MFIKKSKKWILTGILMVLLVLVIIATMLSYEAFEIKINNDSKENIYNVGDLLCSHAIIGGWNNNICYANGLEENRNKYPGTIFDIYMKTIDSSDELPNVEKLRTAVDKYIEINNIKEIEHIKDAMNMDVLCVHIRSGDYGEMDNVYLDLIQRIAKPYKRIYILSGIHTDERSGKIENNIQNLNKDIEKLLKDDRFIFKNSNADDDLCMFRVCRNLLVHRGGYSLIGSLLFQGDNLYVPGSLIDPNAKHRWAELMKDKHIFVS
jgi:hypothetical protein